MGEIIFSLVLMAISAAGFANSFTWQQIEDTSGGPAFWPRIIMVLLFVFALMRLIQLLRTKKEDRPHFVFKELFTGPRGFFLLALVLYVALLQVLGFVICTILFLNIVCNVMIYFTYGTFKFDKYFVIRTICLTAASVLIAWFFAHALNVMVPAGIFGIGI